MPVISVPQLNKKISCKLNDILMDVLQENEIPVASSCLGDGICGKCVLNIETEDELNTVTELEARLKSKYSWTEIQRASCQVKVTTNITVRSTYW